MFAFTHPLVLLLLLPVAAAIVTLWLGRESDLALWRRLTALAVRLIILSAIVLALAGLSARVPVGGQSTVFVADRSASDAHDRSQMESFITDAMASKPASASAGVVSAGGTAAVEQPVTSAPAFNGFQTLVPEGSTDLQAGLDLAAGILPGDSARRVVLLSDGRQNAGDALLSARLLHARGIRVDVVPETVPGGADVLVDSVSVPPQLRTDERFKLSVSLRSTVTTRTLLAVYRGNSLEFSRTVTVHPGRQSFTFAQSPLSSGFHAFHVRITPQLDHQPNNNSGSAFTIVGGPPRILVIAQNPAEAANVIRGLRSTGIGAVLRKPGQIDPSLSSLQQYAAVVLVNTAAETLDPIFLQSLVPYVRDLGRGLVVIGGQESYGLGGYGQTPLEQVLPVKMELPDRPDVPTVGVVLIVESLEATLPINISKAAAKGVVQLLTEQDRIAINDAPDSGDVGWVVHLRPVVDRGPIDQAIDSMNPGDPTSYVSYLKAAYRVLASSPTRLKHIILLGDGDAHDPRYQAVARFIRRHGITISTVVTNAQQPADFQTMRQIAHWGGGRYYQANNVSKIPHVFLHEAQTVARSGIIRGAFTPRLLTQSPLLRDLPHATRLTGYVAVTPKPRAEMVLVSNKADPVLASWQYGLGRAVAWTSDASGLWTRDLVRSPGANRFWSDLVAWTLPASMGDRLFVNATTHGATTNLSVDVPSDLGPSPHVVAHITGPSGHGAVQLEPGSPGRYTASFPSSEEGAYYVTVQAGGQGRAAAGEGGVVVSYPAEYRTTGTDTGFLQRLAAAGGGEIVRTPQDVWNDALPPVFAARSLADAMLILAALLLPVDVALRRLTVTRRDIRALREALARGKKEQAA